MEPPKAPAPVLARDKAFMDAVQQLNSGTPANEVMNQIKQQGLPDNQVREVMRGAFLEANKEIVGKETDIFYEGIFCARPFENWLTTRDTSDYSHIILCYAVAGNTTGSWWWDHHPDY